METYRRQGGIFDHIVVETKAKQRYLCFCHCDDCIYCSFGWYAIVNLSRDDNALKQAKPLPLETSGVSAELLTSNPAKEPRDLK